jgi:hypothetical protein
LKESTSILELALWKAKMDDVITEQVQSMCGSNKKMKIDISELRLQCRVSCGADHVVENVWPFLLPQDFVRFVNEDYSDDDDDYEERNSHNQSVLLSNCIHPLNCYN